jgi:hypothetical protein
MQLRAYRNTRRGLPLVAFLSGDYNRAEPGTADKRVWSETGFTCVLICHKAACAGLAAAAMIDHSEKHRSPIRNTPQPLAFRGTDAKEFPILR